MSDRIFQEYTIDMGSVELAELAAEIETNDDQEQQSFSTSEAGWDLTYSG